MLTRKTQYAWMAVGGLICLFGLVLACKLRDGNRAIAQDDKSVLPLPPLAVPPVPPTPPVACPPPPDPVCPAPSSEEHASTERQLKVKNAPNTHVRIKVMKADYTTRSALM